MERDRLELTTPEGVTLDLELAGVGSRALAGTLDLVIQAMLMYGVIVVMLVGAFAGGGNPFLVITTSILAVAAVIIGYHVLFEVWVGGQTPGKRMIGLRVVRSDGGPVRLAQSLIRTLMRIIDFLPTIYAIGIVTVFATTRNQRLGDLAAGTVVILDRSRHPKPAPTPRRTIPMTDIVGPEAPSNSPVPVGWDVSAITDQEVGLVRRFLDRRWSLDDGARRALAADLAARLRTKVVAPDSFIADEPFLSQIVRIKDGSGG